MTRAEKFRQRLRAEMIGKGEKLLEALAERCHVKPNEDHKWRECRHCLAVAELGADDAPVAMVTRGLLALLLADFRRLQAIERSLEEFRRKVETTDP